MGKLFRNLIGASFGWGAVIALASLGAYTGALAYARADECEKQQKKEAMEEMADQFEQACKAKRLI